MNCLKLICAVVLGVAAGLFVTGWCTGCTTTVLTVERPDGLRVRTERYSFGPRNEIGELNVETPNVKGSMKGYVSDPAGALELGGKALDVARSFAPGAP